MLFNLANLPYWSFLGIGVLLFLLVIVSGGGEEDLELEADVDVDVDADIDTDAGVDISTGNILSLLGVGKAPLILLLATDCSLLGVLGWMFNVAIASVTGSIPSGFMGGVVLALSLLISLFAGGLISQPLGKIFASFGEDASGDRLIGCQGTVSSTSIPIANQGKIGQVDVIDPVRNLVTVNATLPSWAQVVPRRGTQVLVIDRHSESYLVVAKDSADQAKWLADSAQIRDSH